MKLPLFNHSFLLHYKSSHGLMRLDTPIHYPNLIYPSSNDTGPGDKESAKTCVMDAVAYR